MQVRCLRYLIELFIGVVDLWEIHLDQASQGLFLVRLLLQHDPAAFLEKMDDPDDLWGLKAVIQGSSSLLTVYLGEALLHACQECTGEGSISSS